MKKEKMKGLAILTAVTLILSILALSVVGFLVYTQFFESRESLGTVQCDGEKLAYCRSWEFLGLKEDVRPPTWDDEKCGDPPSKNECVIILGE